MRTLLIFKNSCSLFLAISAVLIFSSCKKHETINKINTDTSEYINYSVNGIAYNFTMPADSVFTDSIAENTEFGLKGNVRLSGNRIPASPTNFTQVMFNINGAGPGSTVQLSRFFIPEIGAGTQGLYPVFVTSSSPVMITITEVGAVNEYISGNFSGQLTGPAPANTQYNVTCNFRVRRRI